jgi:hypothetical protein
MTLTGEPAEPHSPFDCTPPPSPWRMVEAEEEEEEEKAEEPTEKAEEPTEKAEQEEKAEEAPGPSEEQTGEALLDACVTAARGLAFKPYDMCVVRHTMDELTNAQQTGTADPRCLLESCC